jgi:hypothetical protein
MGGRRILKLEAGEQRYAGDLAQFGYQICALFALSRGGTGEVTGINTLQILEKPSVRGQ